MKTICPNSSEHKLFIVSCCVQEDQVIDSEGNYIETLGCTDVGNPSDKDWICKKCGAVAVKKD